MAKMYTQDFVNELNHSIDMLRREANQRYRENASLVSEVNVLTVERDNALLRVEELEAELEAQKIRPGDFLHDLQAWGVDDA